MVISVKSALLLKIPLTIREMTTPRSPELPDQRTIAYERNPAFQNHIQNLNARLEARALPGNLVLENVSMMETLRRHPLGFKFKEACQVFMHSDLDSHFNMVRSIILRYSLKIYGLPECPSEDLFLAVYLFVEEVFGIKSKLELCVQLIETDGQGAVGVVFESIAVKNRILAKSNCVEGTQVRVVSNTDVGWILEGLCLYWSGSQTGPG